MRNKYLEKERTDKALPDDVDYRKESCPPSYVVLINITGRWQALYAWDNGFFLYKAPVRSGIPVADD